MEPQLIDIFSQRSDSNPWGHTRFCPATLGGWFRSVMRRSVRWLISGLPVWITLEKARRWITRTFYYRFYVQVSWLQREIGCADEGVPNLFL